MGFSGLVFVTFLSALRLPEVKVGCYFADARLRSLHAGVHLAPPTALADVIGNFSLGVWPERVSCLQGTPGSSLARLESWYPRHKEAKWGGGGGGAQTGDTHTHKNITWTARL